MAGGARGGEPRVSQQDASQGNGLGGSFHRSGVRIDLPKALKDIPTEAIRAAFNSDSSCIRDIRCCHTLKKDPFVYVNFKPEAPQGLESRLRGKTIGIMYKGQRYDVYIFDERTMGVKMQIAEPLFTLKSNELRVLLLHAYPMAVDAAVRHQSTDDTTHVFVNFRSPADADAARARGDVAVETPQVPGQHKVRALPKLNFGSWHGGQSGPGNGNFQNSPNAAGSGTPPTIPGGLVSTSSSSGSGSAWGRRRHGQNYSKPGRSNSQGGNSGATTPTNGPASVVEESLSQNRDDALVSESEDVENVNQEDDGLPLPSEPAMVASAAEVGEDYRLSDAVVNVQEENEAELVVAEPATEVVADSTVIEKEIPEEIVDEAEEEQPELDAEVVNAEQYGEYAEPFEKDAEDEAAVEYGDYNGGMYSEEVDYGSNAPGVLHFPPNDVSHPHPNHPHPYISQPFIQAPFTQNRGGYGTRSGRGPRGSQNGEASRTTGSQPPGLTDATGAPTLRPSAAEFIPSKTPTVWIPTHQGKQPQSSMHSVHPAPPPHHIAGGIPPHQLHPGMPHPIHPHAHAHGLHPHGLPHPVAQGQPGHPAMQAPHLPATLSLRIPIEQNDPVTGIEFLEMYPTATRVCVVTSLVRSSDGSKRDSGPASATTAHSDDGAFGAAVGRYETLVKISFASGVEAMRACGGGMLIRGQVVPFAPIESEDEPDPLDGHRLRVYLPPEFDADVLASDVIDLLEPHGHVVSSVTVRCDRNFMGLLPPPPIVLVSFEEDVAASMQGVVMTMRGHNMTLSSAIMNELVADIPVDLSNLSDQALVRILPKLFPFDTVTSVRIEPSLSSSGSSTASLASSGALSTASSTPTSTSTTTVVGGVKTTTGAMRPVAGRSVVVKFSSESVADMWRLRSVKLGRSEILLRQPELPTASAVVSSGERTLTIGYMQTVGVEEW
ncbi:hypothetical protein HDU97_010228 [Phlyctochytrium planicorne]|nr:hypothetical protein HDU97_010228 [Phlyctochytrium planicorne]